MAGIVDGFRAAFKELAKPWEPSKYLVAGREVRCPHCGNDTFAEGEALLNTVGMTFFHLDWANKTASTLMCAECSRIEWFGQKPTRQA